MEPERASLLGQALTVIGMIFLIYTRLQHPEPATPRIVGIDWLVVVAVGIILASLVLAIRTFQVES